MGLATQYAIFGLFQDNLIELGVRSAIKQRLHPFMSFGLSGTCMHGHEGLVTFVLHYTHIVSTITRFQEFAADETLVLGILFI